MRWLRPGLLFLLMIVAMPGLALPFFNQSLQKSETPILVGKVTIEIQGEGQDDFVILKVLRKHPIAAGDPFKLKAYNQLKNALQNAAEQQGYIHAEFSEAQISLSKLNHNADIRLIFNTGSRYYFGQVRFNPSSISPDLLQRYIPFRYNAAYSPEAISKFTTQLNNSGYFRSVSINPEAAISNSLVPIHVLLEPVPKKTYSLGLGYGTDTGVRASAGLQVIPLNQSGHKLHIAGRGSLTENVLLAQYIIPGLNPVTNQYVFSASGGTLNYTAGYSNQAMLSAAQQHNKTNFQRNLSLNALYERFIYTYQSRNERTTVFPKATLVFKKTSDELFSPSGYTISLTTLGASEAVLSQLTFGQAYIDAKAALDFDTLGLRVYGHGIQGYTAINGIDQLPLSLALLLGGNENLKGYSYNSIGPGKVITYGGIELQKEIREKWYVFVFADSGDVYNPAPRNYQYDTGAGLMWISPVGPIKLGFAQPIDSQWQRLPGSSPRLLINMGPDL